MGRAEVKVHRSDETAESSGSSGGVKGGKQLIQLVWREIDGPDHEGCGGRASPSARLLKWEVAEIGAGVWGGGSSG